MVRTYDFGEAGGLTYVSMEYIEGRDLKHHVREHGAFEVRRGVEILAAVCDALAAAHQLDVVHRDIKPQNIILDRQEVVKVIDFGIAKLKDSVGTTMTDMFVGTPEYISPEMALGKAIDAKTDIYAVGVVMYELFCGKTPFHGGSLVSVLSRHVHEKPVPPRELNPRIPEALEAIIDRAMAKDPGKRHGKIGDLADDLRGFLGSYTT